ncbi:hypothetical protein Y032_0197g1588 [Ancylostoma ceylanicum]|uniref:Uncharacterized protein n=1 Tax=Ancylostoma ceylanicum TaxID=53326 RepID=A0A016SNL6_9BILA|nr:hypothetical protein Y032_0197g1588 [Ancylostoma ceylanicum]
MRHHPHTTPTILHLSKLPFFATSCFAVPKLCNSRVSSFNFKQDRWTWHFFVPAHPHHNTEPVSERLPAFGRRRTLIPSLHPLRGVSPHSNFVHYLSPVLLPPPRVSETYPPASYLAYDLINTEQ